MESIIYVELLGEGTKVYRPVPASKISDNLYKIGGSEIYDPDDEEWEFLPGSVVKVEEKTFEGKIELVAIEENL